MIDLYKGDCLEVMAKLIEDGVQVDLTVTSPPYDNLRTYNDTLNWNEDIWKSVLDRLFKITKDGGVVVWVVGDATIKGSKTGTSFKQALYFKECGFNFHDTIIWQKPNYAPMYPSVKRYDNNYEFVFIFSKGQPKSWNPIKDKIKAETSKKRSKYKRSFINKDGSRKDKEDTNNNSDFSKRNNIWIIPNGQKRGLNHPAPFPVVLAEDLINSWSNEDDLVLDCFLGSGTTGVACKNTNRNFIGIELDDKYFKIAEKRIRG